MKTDFDFILSLLLLTLRGDGVVPGRSSSGKLDDAAAPQSPSVVASHEQRYDEDTTYAFHWDALLLAEQKERVEDFRERRKNWSRKRLEDCGMSIFGALAEPESDLFGDKIVRVVKEGDKSFLDKFNRGDVVVLTTAEVEDLPRECLVVDVGSNWLSVAVGPTWPTGLWETRRVPGGYVVRLDRSVPQSPLHAQRLALSLVRKGRAGRSARQLVTLFCRKMSPSLNDDASCGEGTAMTGLTSEEVGKALAQVLRSTEFSLNKSQCDAICWALQREISIIRGPPGTGKTRVAALVVATAIQLNSVTSRQKKLRVLAVAHSNGAADVLLEALLQVGVPAVRIGRPASVSPNVQHRTAAAMTESHPEVVALRRTASNMKLPPYERSAAARQMPQCLIDMQKLIIDSAPVVVSSCIGAHQLLIGDSEDVQFTTVVLDEAAQTTEPALICALAAAKAQQVVLLGDTKQLPPTITSVHLRDTLGVSPMARLEGLGLPVKALEVQYRLPAILLEHPSRYFYNGLIKSSDSVYQGPPPKGFAWPNNDQPLAFVHVGSKNLERSHDFSGKSNPTEANIVVDIAMGILAGGDIDAKNMAIISPYAKQVQLLRSALSVRRVAGVTTADNDEIRVGTVDSFQGQETDVVIFSSVRSNPQCELGFLRDPRRLCVAITRARRGLILVGDRPVLQACHHWAALIDYCSSNACLMNATSLSSSSSSSSSTLAATAASSLSSSSSSFSSIRPNLPMGSTSALLQTGNFTLNDILADLMGDDLDEVNLALFDDDDDDDDSSN